MKTPLFSAGRVALTVGIFVLLGSSLPLGSTRLPALGKFLSYSHGFWKSAEPVKKKAAELQLKLSGLSDEVDVYFDDRLVPHIFAQSDQDLYFAQGYVTAMHRLFQMDISTRSAEGTLSEIIGDRTLAMDKRQRSRGIHWAAENAIEGWKKFPEYYALLESYADGVNAYVDQLEPADYPVEYKLLDFAPGEWSPYRSALFSKVMAIDLAMTEYDLENTNAVGLLGKDVFDALMPEQNPHQSPIIPAGTPWPFEPVPVADSSISAIDELFKFSDHGADMELGSNNWAVHGSRTATGEVLLCSDPHLYLTLPSVWYEVHLNSPTRNTYGVSLPGLPCVIIGFNDHIAWGLTNVGQDVLDWYRIKWLDDARTIYELDGKPTPADLRIEEYQVRGGKTAIDTVRYTHWGPVRNTGDWKNLAMRWVAHDVPLTSEIATYDQLNQATNYDEYREAISMYVSPAQNFVFGSTEGDVAITVTGKFPLRRKEQGKFVQDGSDLQNAWSGFIPFEHNPHVKNPPRGFVASANQHSTDTTYPYHYHAFPYFEDYRGRYLNERLAEMPKATVADMEALQYDSYSLKAKEALPAYLSILESIEKTELQQKVFEVLQHWDYRYEPDQVASVLFDQLHLAVYRETWDEFYALADSFPLAFPESWKTIDLVKDQKEHPFFDHAETEKIETASDILMLALQDVADEVEQSGLDLDQDTKGNTSRTRISHISQVPGFHRDLADVVGVGDALNATSSRNGPSWRMIVTLGDKVTARVVYPGGQSGNPGSPHYDSMVDTWQAGKYYDALFESDQDHYRKENGLSLKMHPDE